MISPEEGYSTLELMVALGIVGILAFLGVTNFASQLPHYNLAGASRQFISDLRFIRQRAITEGVPKNIQFYPEIQSYRLSPTETRALPSYVRFGVKEGTPHLPGASSLPADGVSFDHNKVTFQPNGTVDLGGTIYLTNTPQSGETEAISVNITGRVKIYRWDGNGWK